MNKSQQPSLEADAKLLAAIAKEYRLAVQGTSARDVQYRAIESQLMALSATLTALGFDADASVRAIK